VALLIGGMESPFIALTFVVYWAIDAVVDRISRLRL
jgi:hypothetical protein